MCTALRSNLVAFLAIYRDNDDWSGCSIADERGRV